MSRTEGHVHPSINGASFREDRTCAGNHATRSIISSCTERCVAAKVAGDHRGSGSRDDLSGTWIMAISRRLRSCERYTRIFADEILRFDKQPRGRVRGYVQHESGNSWPTAVAVAVRKKERESALERPITKGVRKSKGVRVAVCSIDVT